MPELKSKEWTLDEFWKTGWGRCCPTMPERSTSGTLAGGMDLPLSSLRHEACGGFGVSRLNVFDPGGELSAMQAAPRWFVEHWHLRMEEDCTLWAHIETQEHLGRRPPKVHTVTCFSGPVPPDDAFSATIRRARTVDQMGALAAAEAESSKRIREHFAEDLEAYAAETREALGEPPTDDQLQAYLDDRMTKAEVDHVRDWFAVDRDVVRRYFELRVGLGCRP
jgi:hypothetical protein